MTAAEFDALVRLLPGSPGAAREGARRVLVDGLTYRAAASECNARFSAIARVVSRLRQLQHSGCPTCGQPVWE